MKLEKAKLEQVRHYYVGGKGLHYTVAQLHPGLPGHQLDSNMLHNLDTFVSGVAKGGPGRA